TNTSVATSLGTYFSSQISLIFLDMLNSYRMYSELISYSEALMLIVTFLDKAEDQLRIGKQSSNDGPVAR
ncbi:Exportin 1a, partial [Thalictrum thalictroides]